MLSDISPISANFGIVDDELRERVVGVDEKKISRGSGGESEAELLDDRIV